MFTFFLIHLYQKSTPVAIVHWEFKPTCPFYGFFLLSVSGVCIHSNTFPLKDALFSGGQLSLEFLEAPW